MNDSNFPSDEVIASLEMVVQTALQSYVDAIIPNAFVGSWVAAFTIADPMDPRQPILFASPSSQPSFVDLGLLEAASEEVRGSFR